MTTGETPPIVQTEDTAPLANTELRPARTEPLKPELIGEIGKIGTWNIKGRYRDPFHIPGTYVHGSRKGW
jgi:hypothetical protein